MARQKIYKWCPTCNGEGVVPTNNSTPVTCPYCNGAKKVEWGYLKVEQEPE